MAVIGLLALAACSPDSSEAAEAPQTSVDTTAPTTITTSSTSQVDTTEQAASSTTETSTTEAQPGDDTAVVVMTGGITDEFLDVVRTTPEVDRTAVLQTGQLRLTGSADQTGQAVDQLDEGFVIPIDSRAYESPEEADWSAPALAATLQALEPDELVLSESSAALRRLDTGATMTFNDSATFRVGAVLADEVVGAVEAVFVGPEAFALAGGGSGRRVALVDYQGTGEELERILLQANGGEGVRVFGGRGGEDLSDRDRAVLAQIRVKEIFGEFAFRPGSGGTVQIDPDWVEANIVTVDFPLLGATRCHRVFSEIVEEVMQGLVDDGLEDVIDSSAFQGCWNPRFISGSDRLSRHAWGIAVDINFFNPLDGGPGSPVNSELLDRFEAAGVTSGHDWTFPDPGHFEYLTG